MPRRPGNPATREALLNQRVYDLLRGAILRLDLAPGARLRRGEIAARLGVSRAPVADALARLAAEGLVRVAPRRGTEVARFEMVAIREAVFLREAIETAAAAHLAEAGPAGAAALAGLRRSLLTQEAYVAAGDAGAFYAEDAAMHRALLDATGFPGLAPLCEAATGQVNRARQLVLPLPGRIAETLAEHAAILAALEVGDPAAARAAMSAHLRRLLACLEPLQATRPELFEPALFEPAPPAAG